MWKEALLSFIFEGQGLIFEIKMQLMNCTCKQSPIFPPPLSASCTTQLYSCTQKPCKLQLLALCELRGTNILKIKIGKVLAKTRVRALGSMFSSNLAFHKDTSHHVTSFAGKDDSQRAMKQWEGIWQWGYNWNRFVTSASISFACSCLQNTGWACGNHKSSSCPSEEQTTLPVSEFR